ncbi:MAG: phycobilisome protein [Leptolyngbyaceae cyanobacterium MO_188.B28]|nr:phycobilisome protein [Leptolyngbyaceae cyanobacterium MO_188.B28]
MLSQLNNLCTETDGRYATDAELQFLHRYLQTVPLRLSAYQCIQSHEAQIIQQVQARLEAIAPNLLQQGQTDLTAKWKQDTIRSLRYAALALLIDDPETLRENMLLWFQSIIRAFGAEQSCNLTYTLMQDVVTQYLSPAEAELFCPILELTRSLLGES